MKDGRLAVLDQTAIPGGVDRIHDLGKRLFQLLSQFRRQLIPIHYNQPFHGFSFSGISTPNSHSMPYARKFGHALGVCQQATPRQISHSGYITWLASSPDGLARSSGELVLTRVERPGIPQTLKYPYG